MKTRWSVLVSGVCAAMLTGCPSNGDPDVIDAAADRAADTGGDTGTTTDVTLQDATDSSAPTDASPDVQAADVQRTDSSTADVPGADVPTADVPVADVAIDAPSDAGPMPLNGCTTFTDLAAASATRTITFAGTAYTPNCIAIAAGQSVTFSGAFSFHPLTPGVAPSRLSDGPSSTPNPITTTATGTSSTFAFPSAGDYGFYCAVHQSFGMYGVVRVR